MSVIEAHGLTKRFGLQTAVDNLTFEVKGSEIFGMLGPNGAGKTTTIRLLACLLSPTAGAAKVGGYDIERDQTKVRQSVGVLTENFSLYERLTPTENLDFFAEAYGLSNRMERLDRIRELLEFFDLWERRNEKVATLSKGMKQKLALSRALLHDPPILFLDEPTSGLDPESAKAIRDLIFQLSRKEKRAVFLCTHRLEDAEKLCDRLMIIRRSRSVIIGSVDELRDRIARPTVLRVALREIDSSILEAIRSLEQVKMVNAGSSDAIVDVNLENTESETPEVIRKIVEAGGAILSLNIMYPSLEDAYLRLVKED